MITVMLDNDISGHCDLLAATVKKLGWEDYEEKIVHFITIRDAGLAGDTPDREVWRHCQRNEMILLTANRNREDATSLDQTLLDENTEGSLPVLTVSDPRRLYDSEYRGRCVYAILDVVLFIDNNLGTGRQYIP